MLVPRGKGNGKSSPGWGPWPTGTRELFASLTNSFEEDTVIEGVVGSDGSRQVDAVTIDLHLSSGVEAPAAARHALAELSGTVPGGMLEDLRLLVSELVTNSVRHADQGPDGWIDLRVSAGGRAVRVEVSDPGPGLREPRPASAPSADRVSGRGLYLVAQIADRWGADREGCTHVWFEIDRGPGSEAAAGI